MYHILHVAPTEAGQCDVCGAPLFQRSDETPEIQARRYEVYEQDTLPMIAYYRQRGILVEINAEQDVESVTRDILAAIDARKGLRSAVAPIGPANVVELER